MEHVGLLPFGCGDEDVLAALQTGIEEVLGLQTVELPSLPEPQFAYDIERDQHGSTEILREVVQHLPPGDSLVLAVAEVDLFIPMLTFVFGQAQVGGRVSLISTARLKQEFYRLPQDPSLLLRRAVKEAIHELGHCLGLVHCTDPGCVISISTNIRQIDTKNRHFCSTCADLAEEKLWYLREQTETAAGKEDDR